MEEGNWAEALAVWREILPMGENRGAALAGDLWKARQCLEQLERRVETDGLVEKTVGEHGEDWQLLRAAGVYYQGVESWGSMVSGDFRRGQFEGGVRVSSEMRDWVRSVQLFEKAMRLMEGVGAEAETKVEFYGQFAGMRLRTEGWRLQSLTDLTKLPDYEEDGAVHFGRRGMPWGGGGDEIGFLANIKRGIGAS